MFCRDGLKTRWIAEDVLPRWTQDQYVPRQTEEQVEVPAESLCAHWINRTEGRVCLWREIKRDESVSCLYGVSCTPSFHPLPSVLGYIEGSCMAQFYADQHHGRSSTRSVVLFISQWQQTKDISKTCRSRDYYKIQTVHNL